jgi:hypothetical protein
MFTAANYFKIGIKNIMKRVDSRLLTAGMTDKNNEFIRSHKIKKAGLLYPQAGHFMTDA